MPKVGKKGKNCACWVHGRARRPKCLQQKEQMRRLEDAQAQFILLFFDFWDFIDNIFTS